MSRRHSRQQAAALLFALVLALPAALRAQDSVQVAEVPSGMAFGVSVGQMALGDGSITSIGLHVSDLRPGSAGLDLGLVSSPDLLGEGFLVGLVDLGVAYGFATESAIALPRLGISVLGGIGGDVDGVLGLQAGGAVIIPAGRSRGIRIDAGARRYSEFEVTVLTLSIGITGLPRRSASPPAPDALPPDPAP